MFSSFTVTVNPYFEVSVRDWRLLKVEMKKGIGNLSNDLKDFQLIQSFNPCFGPLLDQIKECASFSISIHAYQGRVQRQEEPHSLTL